MVPAARRMPRLAPGAPSRAAGVVLGVPRALTAGHRRQRRHHLGVVGGRYPAGARGRWRDRRQRPRGGDGGGRGHGWRARLGGRCRCRCRCASAARRRSRRPGRPPGRRWPVVLVVDRGERRRGRWSRPVGGRRELRARAARGSRRRRRGHGGRACRLVVGAHTGLRVGGWARGALGRALRLADRRAPAAEHEEHQPPEEEQAEQDGGPDGDDQRDGSVGGALHLQGDAVAQRSAARSGQRGDHGEAARLLDLGRHLQGGPLTRGERLQADVADRQPAVAAHLHVEQHVTANGRSLRTVRTSGASLEARV